MIHVYHISRNKILYECKAEVCCTILFSGFRIVYAFVPFSVRTGVRIKDLLNFESKEASTQSGKILQKRAFDTKMF